MSRRYLETFITTLQVWRYQAQHADNAKRRIILLQALDCEELVLLNRLWRDT